MKITTFVGLAIHPQLKTPIDRNLRSSEAVVALDKNNYLHIPVNRFDFETKADFIAEVVNQAARIYDALAKTHGET